MSGLGYQAAALLMAPLQIIIGIIMMYWFIGVSFVTGIIVMALMIACTFFTSKFSIRYNEQLLKVKDARMKVTQEMLDIIRYIKINSIEKFFYNKIDKERAS
jgi:ABC-type bacteriocin/lantibiotic exporter with double-glycine peptidase domain